MKKLLLTCCAVSALLLAGCKSAGPERYYSVETTYNTSIKEEILQEKIIQAAERRRWDIIDSSPGKIVINYKNQEALITYGNGAIEIRQTAGDTDVYGWLTRLKTSIDKYLATE